MAALSLVGKSFTDKYKPAMPPARNPIDALLDEGATAAFNVFKAPAATAEQTRGHVPSSPSHDYELLDAKLKTIDAKASKAANSTSRGRKRKSNDFDSQQYDSDLDLDDDEDGAQNLSKRQPKVKAKPLASVQKRASVLLAADVETSASVHTAKTDVSNKTVGASKKAVVHEAQKKGSKNAVHVGKTSLSTAGSGKAKTAQGSSHLASLSQPLVAEPSGRPVRKAKKAALGKLRAERGKDNDDTITEDESGDDASSFRMKGDIAHVPGRGRTKGHLPTPATKSNTTKRDDPSKSSGKLQSIKSKAPSTTTSVKKQNPRGTKIHSRKNKSRVEKTLLDSTETGIDAPEIKVQKKTLAPTDDDGQNELGGKLPARRPGTLKRPTRSASRGRKSVRDTPYDFPGIHLHTRNNRSSESKVSRIPKGESGATRQRMQSVSVNHHEDSDIDNSRLLSTSRRAASKEIELGSLPRNQYTTQGKDKELLPQPKSNDNEKAKLKSKRTGAAAHAGKQNATGVESTTPHQKTGLSQANAIMIEQAAQSSSDLRSSPDQSLVVQAKATGQSNRVQNSRRPQTPALISSSPPGANGDAIPTFASDKPTIIAFDRQGPRNQGVTSSFKNQRFPVLPSALSTHDTADASTSGLRDESKGLARTLFPSQSQETARPQSQAPSKTGPSNVSVTDGDIFADFTKNGRNKALTSLLQRRPPTAASGSTKHESEPEQLQDDEDFFVVDDFGYTTLVNDDEQSVRPVEMRTASQVAMPPPKGPGKIVKKTNGHGFLLDKPVAMSTKSAVAKAATEPQQLKKAMTATAAKTAVEPKPAKQATKVGSKKEAKPASLQKASKIMPLPDTVETRSAKEALTEQKRQPKRKRELDELQSGTPNKKTKYLQTNLPKISNFDDASARQLRISKIPQVTGTAIADPVGRPDRRRNRSTRRITQGSRGVDILGSPYPKELEVPIQTTALEIFSQQTDLSSDQMATSDASIAGGLAGRLNLAAVPRMSPPIHREPMSSNGKPLPAAPNESSRAATRVASGPLAEQIITAKHEHPVMEDPFTSSHKLVPALKQTAQGLGFKNALLKHGIIIDQLEPITGLIEDPGKTLVNPTPDFDSDDEPNHAVNSTNSSDVSSPSSPSPAAASKALEDVGDWRNTLTAYQTHLFDAVVIASHRLVRHMVDDETARREIVAAYRRRGEILVAEVELSHAREFERFSAGLLGLKERAIEGLAACGRRLGVDLKEGERARGERRKARVARGGFEGVLEGLVAGLG